MNVDHQSHAMKMLVSFSIIAAFFGAIYALLFMPGRDFPPGAREVIVLLLGVLAGAFKDVVSYWIGSSASSSKKTDALIASKGP